jgi:uncharacterized membrane protein
MTVKTYKIWETIIKFAVCAIVAVSVIIGNWIPIVAAVAVSMVIFIVLRLRVKGVVEDERTKIINQKATYFTYSWQNFAMSLAGVILVFTNHDDLTSVSAIIGFVLFFSAFGFSIVKDLAYYIINRKQAGELK